MKQLQTFLVTCIIVIWMFLGSRGMTYAGGVKYENENGEYVKLGGRIQLQYHHTDPASSDATDKLFFRRFRPFFEGSVHENWMGKFQWDMGKSTLSLKDVFLQYSGMDHLNLRVGNVKFPFSREILTSSKKQNLIERTFVGDHKYGTPDRQTGLHLLGGTADKKITWAAAVTKGAIDPGNSTLDFDSVVQFDAGDDWSEGDMAGARIDFHPLGHVPFSQGDFKRDMKVALGVAAFAWHNDGDNLDISRSNDVDTVMGFELNGALRGGGFSLDAQYNVFNSELVDVGITSGLYENSETSLEAYSIEGGYMVIPDKLEFAAGFQSLDADNYAKAWTRTSVGLNVFVKRHDIKYQITVRMGENKDGVDGNDLDEVFVQAQYVF